MMRTFSFTDVWFIIEAARWTIGLSLIAFVGGALGGLVVALARTSEGLLAQRVATVFTQVFQGTPLLMQLFLVFFGAPVLGFDVSPWTAASVALVLNTSAFLGEIWRGSIQAVPRGQWEAADALGMGYGARMRRVVLPQASRIALPPTVGYMVQVIKGTSLAAIIGFTEITRAGQIINNATFQPLIVFSVVGAVYFALCWPLSLWAGHIERRRAAALAR
jgi:polar amino acid transport system permease protein